MLVIGTGKTDDIDDDEWKGELNAFRMMELLMEHGWEFSHCRDPLIILIEIESNEDEH